MDPNYDFEELDEELKLYEDLKSRVNKRLGTDGENEDVWAIVQDEYIRSIENKSLEQLAKLSAAAYYSVERNLDDPDWSEVEDRIVDFVLDRHRDVRESHHISNYLPGKYTGRATQEIVIHSIYLELTED